MTDIILAVYQLAEQIKNSDTFMALKSLNSEVKLKYQAEMKAFEEAKHNYYDVMETGGVYHPDFKGSAKKLSTAKQVLYEKEEVKHIIKLEKELQDGLNDVIRNCSKIISTYIKAPNEVGLIKEKESCHASKKNGLHR